MLENDVTLANVVIGNTNTSNTVDLFSPTGGGITIPATSMAIDPINNVWYYPTAAVPALGTSAEEKLGVLQVDQGTCDQVNAKANSLDYTVANYDKATFGDPTNNADLGSMLANNAWPSALNGKLVGCVKDSTSSKYWFYQILAVQ